MAASSSSAASSSGPPDQAPAPDSGAGGREAPRQTLKEKIAALKTEQKRLKEATDANRKERRNAVRRAKRLRTKVAGLTDEDLVAVLRERSSARSANNHDPAAPADLQSSPSPEPEMQDSVRDP